jgi:Bacterial Ig-like domain
VPNAYVVGIEEATNNDLQDVVLIIRNVTSATDTTPPTVQTSAFLYETAQSITLQFSEAISSSLVAGDFVLRNTTTSTTVPTANIQLSYNGATNTATLTFAGILTDGNYRLTLAAAGVSDTAGNLLASDYTLDFFVLAGDADHDRDVDVNDLGILASNWQQSPRTFSLGDFDYSGTVDVNDLGILASHWQQSLPQGSAPARPVQRGAKAPGRIVSMIL